MKSLWVIILLELPPTCFSQARYFTKEHEPFFAVGFDYAKVGIATGQGVFYAMAVKRLEFSLEYLKVNKEANATAEQESKKYSVLSPTIEFIGFGTEDNPRCFTTAFSKWFFQGPDKPSDTFAYEISLSRKVVLEDAYADKTKLSVIPEISVSAALRSFPSVSVNLGFLYTFKSRTGIIVIPSVSLFDKKNVGFAVSSAFTIG